ncbi:MAG: DmsE family decaheme c-type cytochrome [Nitrospirae bacterium]|nr:DmsE family decaheme c-type cytochrome [Nitrospirota bacterium]
MICLFSALLICTLRLVEAEAKEVDWTAINPEMADATYVMDANKCIECHEDYMQVFNRTKHDRVFKTENRDDLEIRGCEACHGPLSKHIDAPRSKKYVVSLKTDGPLTSKQKNSICLQCHEKGIRMHWQGSPHEMSGVGCSSCHYISERRSEKNLFINEDAKKACFKCHKERRAQLQRSSHMPLREGKMDCSNCHNPHGGPGPTLLKTASVNETCYTCHAEKRGPMIWEHPPVRENCINCHDPHGSNYEFLLKLKVPYLCQSCHAVQFHPSAIYSGSNLPGQATSPAQQLVGKGCPNCHSQIHGSNHPSGARFQR